MASHNDAAAAFSTQWNSTESFWTEIIPNNVNNLIRSYHGQGCPCCTRPELGRPPLVNWAPSADGTLRQLADYLTSGFNSDQGAGYTNEFYNLSASGTYPKSGTITYNYTGGQIDSDGVASPDWKNLYDEAFKYLSATFGITFNEDTGLNADIELTDNATGAFNSNTGTTTGGNNIIDYSRLNITPSFADPSTFGGYAWSTVIHELGHSLGLGHQGNYNGSVDFNSQAVFRNDSYDISVMSYVDQTQNPNFSGRTYTDSSTFKPADLLALDDLYASQGYGTSNAFTGNTTYGFNTTINSSTSAIWNQMTTWIGTTGFTIADGAGIDTIDLSGFSTGETLDLRASEATSTSPYYSSINGRTNNLSIAVGTVIENAIGGTGADTITGNSEANIIQGNSGNDTIDGDSGNDIIQGNSGSDTIDGGSGNDIIDGGSGNDTINGGPGNDNLTGGIGADLFRLGSGDDVAIDFSSSDGDTIGITSGLTYTLADVGSDLKITASNGASITLNGLQQATFNASTDIQSIGTPPPTGGGGGGGSSTTPLTTPVPTPATNPTPSTEVPTQGSTSPAVPVVTTQQPTLDSPVLGIQPQAAVSTVELDKPLVVDTLQLTQAVVGTVGSDVITGSDAAEVLVGGQGKDLISGGAGADGFLFERPGEFGKQKRDTITDFNPDEGDKVAISSDAFDGINKIKFKAVKGKDEVNDAASTNKTFIYDEKKGMLYFNENGKKDGFGDGGEFAKLLGTPDLSKGDFTLA